ncbi:MAG TPA: hypothetical protein VJB97_01855 [Candidatus Paceibacterota bacterium]
MSLDTRKAPIGKFIIGEADTSEDCWGQIGEPYDTVLAAQAAASALKMHAAPQLGYFIYNENGLMPAEMQVAW